MLWGFLKIGKKLYKLIFGVGSTKRFTFFGMPRWKKWINGSKAYDPDELTIDQLTFWDIGFFMETKLAFYDFQGVQSNFCASCQFQGIGVRTVRTEFGKLFGVPFFLCSKHSAIDAETRSFKLPSLALVYLDVPAKSIDD